MRSKCNGRHDDRLKAKWRDTAGRVWSEYECGDCGRLEREVQA